MKKLKMLKFRNSVFFAVAFISAFILFVFAVLLLSINSKSKAAVIQKDNPMNTNSDFTIILKNKDIAIFNDINYILNPCPEITINHHGKISKHKVCRGTVKNTLKKLNIVLGANDVMGAEADDYIFPNQILTITKIEYKEQVQNEIVPFQTKIEKSDDMLIGESKIVQHGRNGENLCVYKNAYYNDKLWRSHKIKETVVIPAVNRIIKTGTKNILENNNINLKSRKSVLLKTKKDVPNFQLPEIKLSKNDRDLLERLLTGEFGGSFTGACLVAQAIKCAIVFDHYKSIDNLIIGMGYVGSTNIGKTQNAVNAVKYIFDSNGLAIKHRLFYMCTEDYYNSNPGNFHSSQNFILQYQNVKFFDRW